MVLLAVAVFAWIQWLGLAGSGSADTAGGWLAWGSLAMLGLLIAAYLLLWGGGVARRVTAIASLAILAALGWSQGSRLAYAPARDLQEPLRPDFVSGEVRLLTRALSVRGMRTLAIQADPSLVPALAWEMRRFPSVSWGRSAGEAPPDAILRPAGAEPGTLEASYMGTTYRLVGHWRGPPAGLVGFARWYFQRRPPASTPAGIVEPVDYEPVELFLRIEP
jgi:hypothetical protein